MSDRHTAEEIRMSAPFGLGILGEVEFELLF